MKRILPIALCLFAIGACTNIATVETEAGLVRLTACTQGIIRVEKLAPGAPEVRDSSLCVILQPQKVRASVKRTADAVVLSTDSLSARVDKASGCVSFSAKGRKLLEEKPGGFSMTPMDGGKPAYSISQTFTLEPEEAIYGLGQHRYGKLNWRGETVEIFNKNMDISIPVVHSVKGWGLYWDNTCKGLFEDNGDGMTLSSETGDKVDYYFVWGGNADGVIRGLHQLSGTAPMNALWSYGFI